MVLSLSVSQENPYAPVAYDDIIAFDENSDTTEVSGNLFDNDEENDDGDLNFETNNSSQLRLLSFNNIQYNDLREDATRAYLNDTGSWKSLDIEGGKLFIDLAGNYVYSTNSPNRFSRFEEYDYTFSHEEYFYSEPWMAHMAQLAPSSS